MPELLEQARSLARARHYSYRTEKTYLYWIKQFIVFHNKRHPEEMGAPEVSIFLSYLATGRVVAASTRNKALAAVLFLYKDVLGLELPRIEKRHPSQATAESAGGAQQTGGAFGALHYSHVMPASYASRSCRFDGRSLYGQKIRHKYSC